MFAPLFGTALVVAVATGPSIDPGDQAAVSSQQKVVATEALVHSATDCIVRKVTADPRYGGSGAAIGDLIVASVASCRAPVRAMIDGYDRYYGEGAGEAFFMGPYLEVLPKAVLKAVLAGSQSSAQQKRTAQ